MAPDSPSASSVRLPFGTRGSRRSSIASVSSRPQPDKEGVAQALDQIHSSASRSGALTTFDEFGPPPPPAAGSDTKSLAGAGDIVQGRLNGLYSRIRATVQGTKDNASTSPVLGGLIVPEEESSRSTKPKPSVKQMKSSAGTATSPAVSLQTSRLQSPLVTKASEPHSASSKVSDSAAASLSQKLGSTTPKNLLSPQLKAGPSTGTTVEPLEIGNAATDDSRGISSYSARQGSRRSSAVDVSTRESERSAPIPGHRRSHDSSTDSIREHAVSNGPDADLLKNSRQSTIRGPRSRPPELMLERVSDDTGHDSAEDGESLASKEDMFEGGGDVLFPEEFPALEPALQNAPASRAEGGDARRDPSEPMQSPTRPPLLQVSQSHLPGYKASRASSSDGDAKSTISLNALRQPAFQTIEEQPRPLPGKRNAEDPSGMLPQVGRKVLSKEFWMRDENAKDCFYCGETFSTFRRKHHCRTCGQIFDAKCTSLVSGKPFGQSGNLRVCKPCEAILHGNDDDSSVFSEDDDDSRSVFSHRHFNEKRASAASFSGSPVEYLDRDHTKIGTPSMGIPVSRRTGENKRRSAVIEFDGQPALARPGSSRSLRSLSGRPRSSGHKRNYTRHQHLRPLRTGYELPFHRADLDWPSERTMLPAFHNDSIIDPDLAPFMSDEGSSDEEQASIFATLSGDSESQRGGENEKSGLGGLLAAVKRGKPRGADKSVSGMSITGDIAGSPSRQLARNTRRRNLSTSSGHQQATSPRRTKSNSLLRSIGVGVGFGSNTNLAQLSAPNLSVPSPSSFRMMRSASMRGEDAPAVELNHISLQHVRKLLTQMLRDANVPNCTSWEKAMLPILLQCTDDVNPNIRHGDDSDVRNYIKLKKIGGGRPTDTSYISGVVFTKNIALKSMPRSISHPRIVIVTFAIEYARHQQHFMSLEPVIAQEKEYLRNLVNRIAALHPQVLLVQRNVAGLALKFLEEAHIAVAFNVKPAVLSAVARCTKSRIISSVDRLAIDPSQLGRCTGFDVKTYKFDGQKKSYIYLSGCQPDLGCTIVLRGSDSATLRKVKQITEFMCHVVYNLKLETCLMRDECVLIPDSVEDSMDVDKEVGGSGVNWPPEDAGHSDGVDFETKKQLGVDDGASHGTGRDVPDGPPTENKRHAVQPETEAEAEAGAADSKLMEDLPIPAYYSEMADKHKTKISSASPFVKYKLPYLLQKAREQERRLAYLKRLRDRYSTSPDYDEKSGDESSQPFELVRPEMMHTIVEKASKPVRDFLFAVHDAEYDKAMHNYNTQKRQWEGFLSGNSELFDPTSHQKIAVLHSLVNSVTSTPCEGPEVLSLGFYREKDLGEELASDFTLGQYVEDLCHSANTVCGASGCERKLYSHHRQYVHSDAQMSVILEENKPATPQFPGAIMMWSHCRICDEQTPPTPMSENTWKYSFGKYLELTFWSSHLHPRYGSCSHDIHKDHVRYFGFHNVSLRIQFDRIQLYEIVVPRPTITWKVERDLRLKNEQFLKIESRLDKFMNSVKARIKCIHVETQPPEKIDACRAEVERLMKLANEDHNWLRGKLQEKYVMSRYYEIIPLNRAIRAIHEKVLGWDENFLEFERTFFPSEKDIRRLAALQLKKIFLDRDESVSSIASIEEANEETVMDEKTAMAPGEDVVLAHQPSEIPAETAHNMLENVMKEESQVSDETMAKTSSSADSVTPDAHSEARELPLDTPIHALERDDVRHLDLAVSSNFPGSPPKDKLPVASGPATIVSAGPEVSRPDLLEPAPPEPTPLDRRISQTVEEMQVTPKAKPTTLEVPQESKIPRLADAPRPAGRNRPQLLRAQSQPGNAKNETNGSEASSIATAASTSTGKTDNSKPTLAESAKALEKRMSDRLGLGTLKPIRHTAHSFIPRSVGTKRLDSKVSRMAKHFEQLSREFERERLKERRRRAATSKQSRALPLASSKPIVEVYRDAHEAVQEKSSEEDFEDITPPRTSTDEATLDDSVLSESTVPTNMSESPVESRQGTEPSARLIDNEDHTATPSHHTSDIEAEASDAEHTILDELELPEGIDTSQILSSDDSRLDLNLELPKHERNSLMKMLTSFWSERSASGWAPLDYPFAPMEHVWDDSDIVVREDEPSSVIALALSSPDYQNKMRKFRRSTQADKVGSSEKDLLFSTNDAADTSIEKNLLHASATNIKYMFSHRSVRAHCKIFYAESFDALRRKCGVADRFVESLSRCYKWESKGGKTKSLFLRTLDNRFVLKSLSPIEVGAFFKFAPDYFAFTRENLFKGLPSVIAKMFGLFQVIIKNPVTGREFDWYMLVMENLWYHCDPKRRFDLKGSMRNRKIQSTGEEDEVLLDENLVDLIFEKPIFVREHTKKVLKISVFNDTLFLSKQNVMDYSMMAGFDDERSEIIVGIIDCIRTYTWDKKLESWIKDRGKNKPTITSPRDYRNRFRIAMGTYILLAPDCWQQLRAPGQYHQPPMQQLQPPPDWRQRVPTRQARQDPVPTAPAAAAKPPAESEQEDVADNAVAAEEELDAAGPATDKLE